MEITTELIKQLRDKTGISVMQCKKALEEVGGDIEKAVVFLQKKSADIALKKGDRTLGAGIVSSYIHSTGTVGTMIELLCETDFVAKNEEFRQLARDIAMHTTATNPQFLKMEDIDEHSQALATEMLSKELEGLPPARAGRVQAGSGEEMKVKILEGKLLAYWSERVLLNQQYIKDPTLTITNLLQTAIQKFGEKIEIGKFTRFSIKE